MPHAGVILDVTSSMVIPSRLRTIVSEYVSRLGLNFIQLPLVTKNGFVYKSEVLPHAVTSLLASQANPHYDLQQHLKPLISLAAKHGISIMPEVSVSTDATGWHKTGFTVECAMHFCSGDPLPLEIDRPRIFPIIYAVIGELYKTFSSPYIHLGSDERRDSKACFTEGAALANFDLFEAKLTALLEMNGLESENIMRWNNAEQTHHAIRTGRITHFSANINVTEMQRQRNAKQESSSSDFFATVDILDGDAWGVYRRTRELVGLRPTGIMAEIRTLTEQRWTSLRIPHRLIAFALGLSSRDPMDTEESFRREFTQLCQALGWNTTTSGDTCDPPAALETKPTFVTESEDFRKQHCHLYTRASKIFVAKKPVEPFYNLTQA